MRTSYCLATIAVMTAIAGAVYTGLTASATPPAMPSVPVEAPKTATAWAGGEPPALPPIVVDPDVAWPVRVPPKPASASLPKKAVKANTTRPTRVTPSVTAPIVATPALPVAPMPKPRSLPANPVTIAEPVQPISPVVSLPATPSPVIAQPVPIQPSPLPVVNPPATPEPLPATSSPLPAVPPPVASPPQSKPAAPLLAVPPPVLSPPKPAAPALSPTPPAAPPATVRPQPAAPELLPAVPPPTTTAKKAVPGPSLPPPTPLAQPTRPSVGQVVLLQDGKIVEGTVAEEGDKVIIRRGVIDQPFDKNQVQFIGDSKDGVYHFLLKKVKEDDADGRFKLARWCVFNGLRVQGLAEAREVVRLQPAHTLAKEMVRTLEESIRLFNADGSSTSPPAQPSAPAAPGLPAVPPPAAQADSHTPMAVMEEQLDVSPEAVLLFGPRVQPVLVNLCAECHAKADYAGSFKLACGSGHNADPQTTRHNLLATVGQINRRDPAASPLLVKALSIHGGMKRPAFTGPQALAYRVLEAWAYLAAGSKDLPPAVPAEKPQAPVVPLTPAPVPPSTPVLPPPPIPPATDSKPLPPAIPPAAQDLQFGTGSEPKSIPTGPDPVGTNEPVDEFDPSVFNRAVHAPSPSTAPVR